MPIDLSGPVRILSDLHWGHPVSLVRRVEQLRPLFEGAGTVVFNGDTVEQGPGFGGRREPGDAAVFADVCRAAGARPVFVSGNHDPAISELGSLEVAGGKVLVTHGDVLFPEISVWGRTRHEIREACERMYLPNHQPVEEGLDEVIARVREACINMLDDRGIDGLAWCGFRRFVLRQGWPPGRARRIFRCWAETGLRGGRLAERHHTAPAFIVMGHTHFPGVWHRKSCTVINTGSYFPFMGRRLVEIHNDELTVRRVFRRKDAFHPGKVLGRWSVEGS